MATANTTPADARKGVTPGASALIIPLPGAAIARVIQTCTRGRLPRGIPQLHMVRRARHYEGLDQAIARDNRRIQLEAALDRAMNEFCDLSRELTRLRGSGVHHV